MNKNDVNAEEMSPNSVFHFTASAKSLRCGSQRKLLTFL